LPLDRERMREYYRDYRAANRERLREYNRRKQREWRKANPETVREKAREAYRRNPERMREAASRYAKRHPERMREKHRKQTANKRARAVSRIARRWGDSVPRCRYDTLPGNHPLRNLPCFGRLEIDHMKGDGNRERHRNRMTQSIASGKRGVHDLRLLCTLHNLWNRPDDPKLRTPNP
jgi:hypothetical protein